MVFRALFAGSRSSLNTKFGAIIVKAKLMVLLMIYHVFLPRSQSSHRVFVCKTHVFPPLNSWDAPRKKTSRPRISLMAERISGKMLRELCITKACPMFLRSSELSWLAGIMMRALWHQENWTTRCQEMLVDTDTYSVKRRLAITRSLSLSGTCQWILWQIVISSNWKDTSYDLILAIIGRLIQVTT